MSTLSVEKKNNKKLSITNISLLITIALLVLTFVVGSLRYDKFGSLSTIFNVFNDNAYLMVVAVGVNFVLLTGGIDISVASTVAFTSVLTAFLLRAGWNPVLAIALVLIISMAVGAGMGVLIQCFKVQPFIATLAGQFLLRGMCTVITIDSIPITDDFFMFMALKKLTIGKAKLYYYVLVALAIIAIAYYVLKFTKFGRNVYAIGGNEQSALLMGLPVARTKILVYVISSFCASLGGLLFSFYTLAGYPLQNMGMEMDAISSCVIGGTLLTGGVGNVIGSAFGVLIQGLIQTIVTYENLNTWWTKVTIAALLCIFIVIQRLLAIRAEKMKAK
ncbi:sugar ABC transporter permease YjfF [Clostridiaceae bacterium NSJ-31]|uniref:Sugar ABC transporter permease YjfF n=1 Tax=Ligaoa zhengdingensis TaxID=2763658 RepID=A0A926E0I1_9FIRM|nr:galactofuranose ABC transporter, permease protein YjfF [Ligaoa zhengdingensis]MBC8547167.1 sugar ABC transporter permease YjfF [Ligaoa zhengdingensis]